MVIYKATEIEKQVLFLPLIETSFLGTINREASLFEQKSRHFPKGAIL